ncbi:MAG: transcription-repair coupling factor [Parachlamydiales bacterium]|nr:transcription-repair coupling factor [Parachlamydiales bacterium]
MLDILLKSPFITTLLERLKDHSVVLENLESAPKAFLIHLLQEHFHKNVVIISSGKNEDNLLLDLQAFEKNTEEFPAWETMPHDDIPPSSDIIGKRMEVLHTLLNRKEFLCITTIHSILQKVISPKLLKEKSFIWHKNDTIDFNSLPALLISLGYEPVPLVTEKGHFAIRGGIVDIFSISSPEPFRIEFFGNTIEEIRIFDPSSQISSHKTSQISLFPLDELHLLEQSSAATFLDYCGSNTLFVFDHFHQLEEDYLKLKKMDHFSSDFFLSFEELFSCTNHPLFFSSAPLETLSTTTILQKNPSYETLVFEPFLVSMQADRVFSSIQTIDSYYATKDLAEILSSPPHTVILYAPQKDLLLHRLAEKELSLSPKVLLFEEYLSSGFVICDIPLSCVTDTDMTHRKQIRRQKWRSALSTAAVEFHHLDVGDTVVHFHSGIGKYLGIEKQKSNKGEEMEFLCIEYAKGAKLYVPLSQAHLVSRYIGVNESTPSFDELGKNRWNHSRLRAQKQIIGYASELLHLYAERSFEKRPPYSSDSPEMTLFEEEFPYVETQDQQEAITAIKADMVQEKPMERLICGDVGYGKTEVAMRAAFKVAYEGKKQVAVLVPTTVLALQHYETFQKRMADYPLRIALLSRFHTAKENQGILEKTRLGQVDILIGTHRLLSKDVLFNELGLLIIDEEQRFGVRSKEHLKKLKKGIDSLSLSATPIPRTLYLSLVHARDMSVINTPPQDRLPIKTIISLNEDPLIKNALNRELARDGQIFFIHNRVESIHSRAKHIHSLVPECCYAVVHGQMPSEEIDAIFHQFSQGKIDLLFSTTIVENGIDIPNANTILIDNAHTFGLADLYQLRGRVGRWNRTAYAYFLTPKNQKLPEIAQKRLHALVESGGYGGGMKIAMRDLEIRGAGDILGIKQSGQVSSIGFHLYCKLLKKAIMALKKKMPISFTETKIECSYPASLPEHYIPQANLRMELYNRLGEIDSEEDLDKIFAELRDRFGPIPPEAIWLYHLFKIRLAAQKNNILAIKIDPSKVIIEKNVRKILETRQYFLPKSLSPEHLERLILEKIR